MRLSDEIKKYVTDEEDKKILLWLTEQEGYTWSSTWHVFASCEFVGRYPNTHKVWSPTEVGRTMYYSKHPEENRGCCSCPEIVMGYVSDNKPLCGVCRKEITKEWKHYKELMNLDNYTMLNTKRKCKCGNNKRMTDYYDNHVLVLVCTECYNRMVIPRRKATKKDQEMMDGK